MGNIRQKIKIAGILILIVIALIVYFIYSSKQKKSITPQEPIAISSSTPANDSTEVSVFDPITITFNQPVDASTIDITSGPAESWTISQMGPNSIEVNHKLYLRVAMSYVLNILQHGASIATLTFETAHEQNDPRELQGLQTDLNQNYPLLSLTPYDTPDYRVVYSGPLTIEIDLKSSIGPQDAIQEVQSWVQSNGVDPSTHKYTVVNPSPSPSPAP
jgi:hypothetical protein